MYGGRVTDSYDRRILATYLEEYAGDFLFDASQPFFFARTAGFDYTLPPQGGPGWYAAGDRGAATGL